MCPPKSQCTPDSASNEEGSKGGNNYMNNKQNKGDSATSVARGAQAHVQQWLPNTLNDTKQNPDLQHWPIPEG